MTTPHPEPCGKAGYPSKRLAAEHAIKRTRENRTLQLRVYHCPDCGLWHITHKPEWNEELAG